MSFLRITFLVLFTSGACLMWGQGSPGGLKLVTLEKVEVQGSRLPEAALRRVTGLAVGQQVNDLIVNAACRKITATGLVKSVDYAYDLYPDKPTVALILTVVDEKPLVPATIVPQADGERIWKAIQEEESLVTRELPPTEKALQLYSSSMESALKKLGRDNEYVAPQVRADASGAPSGVVFTIRTYKQSGRLHQ